MVINPKHFGGLGGYPGTVPFDEFSEDGFAQAMSNALGEQMRGDRDLCAEVWSALANTTWKHLDGHTASYSFRAAGDLIASIRGEGEYMDWYCSGPYATVSDRVSEALGKLGWTWREDDWE